MPIFWLCLKVCLGEKAERKAAKRKEQLSLGGRIEGFYFLLLQPLILHALHRGYDSLKIRKTISEE